jgi:dUTP pyrophosphatase
VRNETDSPVGEAYFVKLHKDARIPEYKTAGSAACDLIIPQDFTLLPRAFELIGTGLICVPPPGYHWHIYLRSSAPMKYPGLILANCVGIIDSDYCGPQDELKLILLNQAYDRVLHFPAGVRIAQMRLVQNLRPSKIKEMSYEELRQRSRGGFGSTGQ